MLSLSESTAQYFRWSLLSHIIFPSPANSSPICLESRAEKMFKHFTNMQITFLADETENNSHYKISDNEVRYAIAYAKHYVLESGEVVIPDLLTPKDMLRNLSPLAEHCYKIYEFISHLSAQLTSFDIVFTGQDKRTGEQLINSFNIDNIEGLKDFAKDMFMYYLVSEVTQMHPVMDGIQPVLFENISMKDMLKSMSSGIIYPLVSILSLLEANNCSAARIDVTDGVYYFTLVNRQVFSLTVLSHENQSMLIELREDDTCSNQVGIFTKFLKPAGVVPVDKTSAGYEAKQFQNQRVYVLSYSVLTNIIKYDYVTTMPKLNYYRLLNNIKYR